MNQPVGYCGSEMTKSRPESALGNAVVDLLINYVNTEKSIQPDLCVMNFGGLRTSLNPGIITRGKVYELMPFDNSLVLVELNSDEMDQLATHIVNRGGEPIGGTNKVSLSNLGGYSQFTIDQAINSKESYQILTSDYLANGGDGFSMFAAAGDKINLNVLIRDALIHQFQTSTSEQQPLTGHVEGRIQLSGHE
jgi:2',3'-cyclic-nucleotide 2'-phosphodiesterase (5'-nucleotidase family)